MRRNDTIHVTDILENPEDIQRLSHSVVREAQAKKKKKTTSCKLK